MITHSPLSPSLSFCSLPLVSFLSNILHSLSKDEGLERISHILSPQSTVLYCTVLTPYHTTLHSALTLLISHCHCTAQHSIVQYGTVQHCTYSTAQHSDCLTDLPHTPILSYPIASHQRYRTIRLTMLHSACVLSKNAKQRKGTERNSLTVVSVG